MDLKAQLKAAVEQAAHQMGMPVDAAIQETPANKPGDYGTPAAFQMAKAAGKNPAEVAAQLVQNITLPAGIKKVEAAGPFINFFLDGGAFVRGVVREAGRGFGRGSAVGGASAAASAALNRGSGGVADPRAPASSSGSGREAGTRPT